MGDQIYLSLDWERVIIRVSQDSDQLKSREKGTDWDWGPLGGEESPLSRKWLAQSKPILFSFFSF